jgi:hypothetical protein
MCYFGRIQPKELGNGEHNGSGRAFTRGSSNAPLTSYFDSEPLAWQCSQVIIVGEMIQYAEGISNVSQRMKFGTWYPAALGFEVPIRGWAPSQHQAGEFVHQELIDHFVFATSLGNWNLTAVARRRSVSLWSA